ncbi:ERCC4 domain-containing protein [Fundidesulfovibrio agrisoli]|uniref:ERCC4 domain-containing protein n=1 Tax=Fundidesulfovibrio agrisoli TaxID=2922717 RepID=UPI001FAB48F6|nr:ERCC4 domain-containing protein [Fundidesulfovibrio agrisoli]
MLPIIIDTREQLPFPFAPDKYPAHLTRGTLTTGDYSLAGLEHCVSVERKSLDDLIGCLTVGRERFERELERSRFLECFAVVIEASVEDVARHRYTSRMDPHAALQSILAFQVRYRCPFVWAGSRSGAEYATYWTLEKFQREKKEALLEQAALVELEAIGKRRGKSKSAGKVFTQKRSVHDR